MSDMSKTIVTSAEFTRQFGYLRQSLGDAPVYITHHGRETHVLLTAMRYAELSRGETKANGQVSGTLPTIAELANWIDYGLLILDDESRIVLANRTMHMMTRRPEGSLEGRDVIEALPEMEGSLIQIYIQRALATGEHSSADLPSVYRKDNWNRFEIFPSANGVTILAHDITDDVKRYRLADGKKAIVDAMAVHGGIGRVRLNARGLIEQVDAAMVEMLKIPEQRLTGIGLIDLVPVGKRVALREQIDRVLSGGGPVRVETEFLANDGEILRLCGGLVELRGAYAAEGAVFVATRA